MAVRLSIQGVRAYQAASLIEAHYLHSFHSVSAISSKDPLFHIRRNRLQLSLSWQRKRPPEGYADSVRRMAQDHSS